MANTILLKGRSHRVEAVAGGAITPGHLIMFNSAGELVVHGTAGGAAARIFAVENDIVGLEIGDASAEDDYVQAEHLYSGCEVLAFCDNGGDAIVIGDLLESAGDGSLVKNDTGVAIAYALEAVDNSGGSAHARIKIALL